MKQTLVGILFILLAAAPAAAQDRDHTDVVAAAKAAAIAAGVDVDSADECQRFEITKRVAVLLAGEGAGLLEKKTGNRCDDRSVDIIAYPSGRIIDILKGGDDGPNTPHWQELTPVSPSRWMPPFDVVAPAPEPPATVEHDETDLSRILYQLEQLRTELAALRQAEADEHAATRQEIKAFRESAKRATSKFLEFVPSILSALGLLAKTAQ